MGLEVKDFTPDEQKMLLERYAQLNFANLKKNIIQDLVNSRNESVILKKYKKEEIIRMLENPQKNERKIRELSGFIYMVSGHYRRLVDYYSTILLYNYTIIPTKIPVNKPNKTQYKKDYITVVNEAEKYNLRHEAQKAIKITVRDGVFYGICYESEDSFYIKNVPANLCKISSIEDGVYRFSFDMAYFNGKEDLLPMYGNDFITAYYAYHGDKEKGIKGDKKKKWYEVPNGICIVADESSLLYHLPIWSSLCVDVTSIEDYKLLHKAKAENDNYKALSAKVDTDEQGVPLLDYSLVEKYYGQMAQNLPENVGLLMSPFTVTDFTFQTSTASTRNDVTESINTFWQGAGMPPSLMGGGNITSQGGLLLSVKPDEALAFTMLQQFERYFNMRIKKMNLKNSFKISFSQESIFNQDEYTNRTAKGAQYATPTKLVYMRSLGMTPSDIMGMTYLEEEVLSLSDKVWNRPLISSNTTSNATEASDGENGGRPNVETTGNKLSDAGEISRERN